MYVLQLQQKVGERLHCMGVKFSCIWGKGSFSPLYLYVYVYMYVNLCTWIVFAAALRLWLGLTHKESSLRGALVLFILSP